MSDEAQLEDVLRAGGASVAAAQDALLTTSAGPRFAVTDLELDVKVAFARDGSGALSVAPVSARDLRAGDIAPELVSSVRVRYVAVVDPLDMGAAASGPLRSAEDVEAEALERADVRSLVKALGGVQASATFLRGQESWLVRVALGDVTVREIVLPDRVEG